MRVMLAALVLLAGCAEYPGFEEATYAPPADDGPTQEVANGTTAPDVPVVPIATVDYTAPVPIDLGRAEGDGIVLRLQAGPDGLTCIAETTDGAATPAGYRVDGSWARCALEAQGTNFTSASSQALPATLPVLHAIPVEAFTWHMEAGRVLVNNSGAHEEVLHEVHDEVSAAPSAEAWHWADHGSLYWYPYTACDVPWQDGTASLLFDAFAHNGRAVLEVELGDREVVDVRSSVPPSDGNTTGEGWWIDEGRLVALGPWAHHSHVDVQLTLRFAGEDDDLGLIPPPDCTGAVFVDYQELPVEVRAIGIAAGWLDLQEDVVPVEVWHL